METDAAVSILLSFNIKSNVIKEEMSFDDDIEEPRTSNTVVVNLNAIRTIESRNLAKKGREKNSSDFDISVFNMRREVQLDSDICR